MIQVLHVSAECYPAAKTGGLGDVVGSLPKYMTAGGMLTAAVIPKYSTKWIGNQNFTTVFYGSVRCDWRTHHFSVQQESSNKLGFPFFVIDIPGLYDRPGIYNDPDGYPYGDEIERYLVFQQAVLKWLISFPWHERPRVLHCHDHHSGMIPWMMKYCPEYEQLAPMPTVFTIHNGQYQGAFSWKSKHLLPFYKDWAAGLLDWNGAANPMAAAVRSAWAVSTVSQSYLMELHQNSLGLEPLFQREWQKQWGIINGIDAEVWNPATDPMIAHRYEAGKISEFKSLNKKLLCEWFGLQEDRPLVSFIGRMVGEKGADLLPDVFKSHLHAGGRTSFLILGTGESWTQDEFRSMAWHYRGRVAAVIDYNEALSHQIYAGSDFLIMPSRVEPCGLNQMYSMRYGTIPIVRGVGGLKDTVPDIAEPEGRGRGFRFDQFSVDDCALALHRATSTWYNEKGILEGLRRKIMGLDFSWENTIQSYCRMYHSIGADVRPVEFEEVEKVAEVNAEVAVEKLKKPSSRKK